MRSTLPGESWRTLLQTFRTRIFLTLSDEASSKLGSEAGGATEGAILDFGIDSRAWSRSAGALEAEREPTE